MMEALPIFPSRRRSIDRVESSAPAPAEDRYSQARLLAAASHDLRQPLQAIGLWIEILLSESRDDRTNRILANINETARSVESVLGSLLDISKLELGRIPAHPTDFSVSELLERVAATHAPAALSKGLRLRVRSSKATVRSDRSLLERIVSNFVANAVRYTEQGGVLIGCRKRGKHLSIEIWDTGLGIPADRLHDIFVEFVQLHRETRERNQGAGLGLSIVKRIATLLGHEIGVSSRIGEGSCFRVEVPLARLCAPAVKAARERISDETIDVHGAFVVFIDDERQICEAMQQLLERWGCHVVAATSGSHALEQLAAHLRLPDILIADYRLLDRATGLQAIEEIRTALDTTIPAVIISASPIGPIHARRRIATLSKPVHGGELKRTIARSYSRAHLVVDADYRISDFRTATPTGARQQRPASG